MNNIFSHIDILGLIISQLDSKDIISLLYINQQIKINIECCSNIIWKLLIEDEFGDFIWFDDAEKTFVVYMKLAKYKSKIINDKKCMGYEMLSIYAYENNDNEL